MWPLLKLSCLESTKVSLQNNSIHTPSCSSPCLLHPNAFGKMIVSTVCPTHKKKTKTSYQVCHPLVSLFWFIQTLIPSRWPTIPIFSGLRGLPGLKTGGFKTRTVPVSPGPLVSPCQLGWSRFWPFRGFCQIFVRKAPLRWFQRNHLKSLLYQVRFLATRGQIIACCLYFLDPFYHF